MPTNHAMVDIETLGTNPGSVIPSIGAVKFDPDTNELGSTFYTNISIQSCLNVGLTVDGGTIEWWMEQSEGARKGLFDPTPLPLAVALCNLEKWFKGAEFVWSHGSMFDIVLLESAYGRFGYRQPWSHRNVRDTRTLFALAGLDYKGTKHTALEDAIDQAKAVQQAYKLLKGGGSSAS